MTDFDPVKHIENSDLLVDADGHWPTFHDARVQHLALWRGDMRPDENVWIGVVLELSVELAALEHPFTAVFKFHDCCDIEAIDFNH